MKKRMFSLVVGAAVLIISLSIANATSDTGSKKNGLSNITSRGLIQEKPASQEAKVLYTCPMHPSVSSDKPGKCPTCGMNLVKKDVATVTYTCPMHPEVTNDKAGKCPKCGMNLEKKAPKKDEPKK
jgi:hypothetical protein